MLSVLRMLRGNRRISSSQRVTKKPTGPSKWNVSVWNNFDCNLRQNGHRQLPVLSKDGRNRGSQDRIFLRIVALSKDANNLSRSSCLSHLKFSSLAMCNGNLLRHRM
jgi:hypothetical protein